MEAHDVQDGVLVVLSHQCPLSKLVIFFRILSGLTEDVEWGDACTSRRAVQHSHRLGAHIHILQEVPRFVCTAGCAIVRELWRSSEPPMLRVASELFCFNLLGKAWKLCYNTGGS